MNPVSSLSEEHGLLHRVLDALDAFVERAAHDQSLDREELAKFSDFFRAFGDVHHATKEEQVLFPTLALLGAEWERGPLAGARHDHRQERYLLRNLDHATRGSDSPQGFDLERLFDESRAFSRALRQHLRMEEEHVLPLVATLCPGDQATLAEKLARFDRTPPSVTDLPVLEQSARDLVAKHAPQTR